MTRIIWLVLAMSLWPIPLWAQADDGPEWELQRCIWRCLAASPGASSAQYNQCVADSCSSLAAEVEREEQSGSVQGVPQGTWFASGTGDGLGNLAGFADPRTQNSFYLICGVDGRRNIALFGPEGPAATLTLQVDGQTFTRAFVPYAGGYYATLPPDAPEIAALRSGRTVAVRNQNGTALIAAGLNGAAAAIAAACG